MIKFFIRISLYTIIFCFLSISLSCSSGDDSSKDNSHNEDDTAMSDDDDDDNEMDDTDMNDDDMDDNYDDTVIPDDTIDDDSIGDGVVFDCSWDEEGTDLPYDDDTIGDPCEACHNCHEGIPTVFEPPQLKGVTLGGKTWTVYDNGEDICWVCAQCYVHHLSEHSFCGYQDWRLPIIEELQQLYDSDNPQQIICSEWFYNIYIRMPFYLTCGSVWSSETLMYLGSEAAKVFSYKVNGWAESDIWWAAYTNVLSIRP